MLPLAHMGIALMFASLLGLPFLGALIGGLAPDIVDKPLFALGLIPCGRFFAHSIFFGPIIAGVAFLITRRRDVALAVLLGVYVHLLLDARYFLPWFYPIVEYSFYCPPTTVSPDLVALAFEGIGVLLIPIVLVLKPRIKYLESLIRKWRGVK
jgi:membrane-bound metal-dependent hydrolase YbcI (DUF457 family)